MNKKLLGIISIVMILVANSMAVDFMGPPTAGLKEGQFTAGYTFDYSKSDWLLNDDISIDAVKVMRNYATFNYGLVDESMELYGFLGLSGIDGDDLIINWSNDFAFGIGAKITANRYDNVKWGALIQTSWLKASDNIDLGTDEVDIDFHVYELQIAVGPSIEVSKGWTMYGGPFVYVVHGKVEADPASSLDFSGDVEQDNGIGGYIGTQIELFKNVTFMAEYASTGNSTGLGGNIAWRF